MESKTTAVTNPVSHKPFRYVRVVSRNFIMDIVVWFQNVLGTRLTPYERMVNKGLDELYKELPANALWWRLETTSTSTGSIVLILYGEQA